MHNVLSAGNFIQWLKKKFNPPPRILFSSTYAVALGQNGTESGEEPLLLLPPRENPYAHCKALAESAFIDSGLPVQIFRLGILVGTTENGEIEKVDGPYPSA